MKRLLLLSFVLVVIGVGVVVQQRAASEVDLYAVQTGSMGEPAPLGSPVTTRPPDPPKAADLTPSVRNGGKLTTHIFPQSRVDRLRVPTPDTKEPADPGRSRRIRRRR